MRKKDYKEILLNNGYINFEVVKNFLREGCIADYEVISEIFNGGMSDYEYQELQEALDEIESGYLEEDEEDY
jgi:hypothetical protein